MINIRAVCAESDAEQIAEIYNPYVLNTQYTYECEAVSVERMKNRIIKTTEKYPWIVAEKDGRILGYAYASKFRGREAYAWNCKFSVYVREELKSKGIGAKLYTVLLETVKRQGYVNVFTRVNIPNEASEALHRKFGFEEIGIEKGTGYKNGCWRDMRIFMKRVADFDEPRDINYNWREILKSL